MKMESQMPSTWYSDEIAATFNFVVKTGFVTKPLLGVLHQTKCERRIDRIAVAIGRSKLFSSLPTTGRMQAWRLSRIGKYECRKEGIKPSFPPKIMSRAHDEIAAGMAIELVHRGIVSDWQVEAQFIVAPTNRIVLAQGNRGQKYPDLILALPRTTGPLKVAVELELSRKSQVRYDKALMGYRVTRAVDAVVFATASAAINASIESAIRRARIDPARLPIFFANAAELRANPGSARLQRGESRCDFASLSVAKRTQDAA